MRIPLSWLREFVTWPGTVAALAERLTAGGLTVEAIDEVGRLDPGVRIGRLLALEPHPASERLQVCRVEVGGDAPLTIVSGAPGLAAGLHVAVALPGARLGAERVVEAVDLRGVRSSGVLCSEEELGLGDEASVVLTLPAGTPVGGRLADLDGVADTVLEIEVTPNRGDCLSVLGVAREVAALTGARLRHPRPRPREVAVPAARDVRVRIEAPDRCPRYCARVVHGVRAAVSPLWLRLRLRRSGMRPLGALVDATNHVMLERGQPLHAFDLGRVRDGQVVVRTARPGERLVTLDGVERALEPEDLVIADPQQALALAGVMGGRDSEVTDATTAVLLESAWFQPASVRRTARRTGLVSQAAYRFERRVDPAMVVEALDAVAALVVRVAGGRVAGGIVEDGPGVPPPEVIRLRPARVQALLGASVSRGEMARRLRALGATCRTEGTVVRVTPPSHRGDLAIEEDLIEEIARIAGYDNIPTTLPEAPLAMGEDGSNRLLAGRVRRLLVAEGLAEMVTLSFTDADSDHRLPGYVARAWTPLAVVNPLSSESGVLRRTPLVSLLRAVARNVGLGAGYVGAFELGKGYGAGSDGTRHEAPVVALVLRGAWPPRGVERSGPAVDFADVKGIVDNLLAGLGITAGRVGWKAPAEAGFLHPGQSALVTVDGEPVGVLGALHPEVVQGADLAGEVWVVELDLPGLAHYGPRRVTLRPIPRFPAVTRDLAAVVDEAFQAGEIVQEINALGHPQIESVRLFDCYRGAPVPAGKKSLAYTIAYRAADRTLTDDDVKMLHGTVLERLQHRFRLEFRS